MKNINRIFIAILFVGLIFTTANAQDYLTGGEWRLVEATSEGDKVVFTEKIKTTISFGKDGKASGNSGCNRFSTSYVSTDKTIEFKPFISTKMACDGERMKQETTFFSVIGKTDSYKFEGAYVIFYDKSSRNILKFEHVLREDPQDEIHPNKC